MSFAHLHGAGYASILAGRSDIDLRVADENAERGKPIADSFGVPFTASYADLLDWGPDGVVVCSENAGHRGLVEQAAAAGAHVLCEKPLATSLADGRAMIDTCAAAGVTLMTAFPVRFASPVVALERLVREGGLGKVHGIAGTNAGTMPGGWFVDPELAGGGAVMDHTVHVADLMRWMLDSEAVEVYAQINRLLYPDLPVETAGTIAVTFADGTAATIDCSWSRPNSYPTWGGVTLEFVGEKGIASTRRVRADDQRLRRRAGPQRLAGRALGALGSQLRCGPAGRVRGGDPGGSPRPSGRLGRLPRDRDRLRRLPVGGDRTAGPPPAGLNAVRRAG